MVTVNCGIDAFAHVFRSRFLIFPEIKIAEGREGESSWDN